MSATLIIFAKAPVAGQAKTRLAPALGAQGAADLAERLLEHCVRQSAAAGFDHVQLCVTPDATHPAFLRLAREHGVGLGLQGEGDLGQRMSHALALALASYPQALLIGTDAPALGAKRLAAAREALQEHEAVFVPALDGGYALVGLRRHAPALFEGIAWSTAAVMAQTRDRARATGMRWAELAPVADIDEPEDLVHLPPGWTHRP